MGFNLAHEFILLDLACRNDGRTQLDAAFCVCTELEFVLVKVVAIGNLEAGLNLTRLFLLCRELECLFRLQQVVVGENG